MQYDQRLPLYNTMIHNEFKVISVFRSWLFCYKESHRCFYGKRTRPLLGLLLLLLSPHDQYYNCGYKLFSIKRSSNEVTVKTKNVVNSGELNSAQFKQDICQTFYIYKPR